MVSEPGKGIKIVTGFVADLQRFAALAARWQSFKTVYTSRFTPKSLSVNIRVHHSEQGASIYI